MDCTNNIIQIIQGIYISNNSASFCESYFQNLNIKYLININNTLNNQSVITYHISIDEKFELMNTTASINIDLDKTNEFIITALQQNSNILICNTNYNIPLLICGAFLVKYLNLSPIETIYWISKKLNTNEISKNICFQLFEYMNTL